MGNKAIKKRLISPILRRFTNYYFSKPRSYSFKNMKGVILPGVFYPYFTISTKLLLNFLDTLDIKGKKVLELGCGTGLISTQAAMKGAVVIASDINPKAIENVQLNAQKNGVEVESILSDLFLEIPNQSFDFIIINPPYYPKDPKNEEEQAWFCGENFEYFEKLFDQLGAYYNTSSKVYLILSEDCKIDRIKRIAHQNKFGFDLVFQTKKQGEENYIFMIKKI